MALKRYVMIREQSRSIIEALLWLFYCWVDDLSLDVMARAIKGSMLHWTEHYDQKSCLHFIVIMEVL